MEATPPRMTFRDAQHRVHMDMVKTRMFLLGLGSGTTLTLFIASILLMVASYSPREKYCAPCVVPATEPLFGRTRTCSPLAQAVGA